MLRGVDRGSFSLTSGEHAEDRRERSRSSRVIELQPSSNESDLCMRQDPFVEIHGVGVGWDEEDHSRSRSDVLQPAGSSPVSEDATPIRRVHERGAISRPFDIEIEAIREGFVWTRIKQEPELSDQLVKQSLRGSPCFPRVGLDRLHSEAAGSPTLAPQKISNSEDDFDRSSSSCRRPSIHSSNQCCLQLLVVVELAGQLVAHLDHHLAAVHHAHHESHCS